MKKVLLTILVTIAIFLIAFYIYIESGSYDISQTTPHNKLTEWIIKTTKHKSIDKAMESVVVPPNINDSAVIVDGFRMYNHLCKMCHGAPGDSAEEMAMGLYPDPPLMYKKKKQEDPREFFWITKNGIKMTSMPAYGPSHGDERIWVVTAFVTQKLNKMTGEEYAEWVRKYYEE